MIENLPDTAALTAFVASAVRLATPIGFAALGGVIAERSGVYNVGLEGMILAGALGAAIGAFATGSPAIGLAFGLAAGVAAGMLLALLAIGCGVNQLVAGVALNLFCLGLTGFAARAFFGQAAGAQQVPGFSAVAFPDMRTVPYLGELLFRHDIMVYGLAAVTVAVFVLIYRTPVGLILRATGDNPRAVDSAGVNVNFVRVCGLCASAALAALAGCHLVLCQVYVFSEGMSAGKGFLALAAVILGRWHPVGAVLAAFFFGLCDAAQFSLQFAWPNVPYQIFQIVPFAASLLILAGVVKRSSQPRAAGTIFRRETR